MKISNLIEGQFLKDEEWFVYIEKVESRFTTARCLCLTIDKDNYSILNYEEIGLQTLETYTIITKEEFLDALNSRINQIKKNFKYE